VYFGASRETCCEETLLPSLGCPGDSIHAAPHRFEPFRPHASFEGVRRHLGASLGAGHEPELAAGDIGEGRIHHL
jgi:hypothetical protein